MRTVPVKLVPAWLAGFALLASASGCDAATPIEIYDSPSKAPTAVQHALAEAAKEHKNVLLDFGANWCGDCRVLYRRLHGKRNGALLRKNFITVYINVGETDRNLDLAKRYQVPVKTGIPQIAVVDEHGKVIGSQLGVMSEDELHDFLLLRTPQNDR
jgi:Thiol:disulfide interchange protein